MTYELYLKKAVKRKIKGNPNRQVILPSFSPSSKIHYSHLRDTRQKSVDNSARLKTEIKGKFT